MREPGIRRAAASRSTPVDADDVLSAEPVTEGASTVEVRPGHRNAGRFAGGFWDFGPGMPEVSKRFLAQGLMTLRFGTGKSRGIQASPAGIGFDLKPAPAIIAHARVS